MHLKGLKTEIQDGSEVEVEVNCPEVSDALPLDGACHAVIFVISEASNTIEFFVDDVQSPKNTIPLDTDSVSLAACELPEIDFGAQYISDFDLVLATLDGTAKDTLCFDHAID